RTIKPRPRQTPPETGSTQFPTMTVFPEAPGETPASRPIPNLPPLDTSSGLTPTTPPSSTGASQPASPLPQKTPARASAGPVEQISESASYSPELRKIVDLALDLAGRNLGYKYVSADPKNGGMDSSGFIYYVLTQSGVKNVPRDAREQYIWVRKAGNFQAVLAQRDDTFELDALKPGDLLFWVSNYGTSRDPDITQTMIYLGREKGSNQRLMVGASESLLAKAQKKSGVGVFEFKVVRPTRKSTEESAPVFVGYGQIPALTTR
ncbi:MAG TPA: NlpC/P60 family protein, partial [Chthoniobacterales bacterium]|nr:NlpC/P60 family protein [Chthoniobacterales bacterium]